MTSILHFFANLLLFTGGLAVLILWIVIFIGVAVEIHDLIMERPNKEEEN